MIFVCHLAKEITGGYSSSDIFSNEAALVSAVATLDSSFNNTFNNDISSSSSSQASNFLPFGTGASSYVKAAYNLFQVNLQSTDGGAAGTSRSDQLLADISQASLTFSSAPGSDNNTTRALNIPLRFSAGDRIAVRVVYKPKGAFSGNGVTPSNRSYKVLFKLVA